MAAIAAGGNRLKKLTLTNILILDGAMGTMLQAQGLPPGVCPESWNLDHPGAVQTVHEQYLAAGATVIQTNTFGANRFKLAEYQLQHQVAAIIEKAVGLARKAARSRALVAVSLGPTGLLSPPLGTTSFQQFYDAFAEVAEAAWRAGADLISIETMTDLIEIKAAVAAVRTVTPLPVLAQMTFEPSGRTLMGVEPETAAIVLSAAGADAVGANCSGGAAELLTVIQRMAEVTGLPLVVQPNAGLPRLIEERTCYTQTPAEMAAFVPALVEAGAWIIGGCCGTTPEHIRLLARAAEPYAPKIRQQSGPAALSSRSRYLLVGSPHPLAFIGERINPTARKKLAADISQRTYELVLAEAREQVAAGAQLLDVNVGVPGIDETVAMAEAVVRIQAATDVPLVLDSTSPAAIEAGLQAFAGKPLINSVNGKPDSLEAILPLARHYGAAVLGLTLDESGIPETAVDRLRVAQRIVARALELGMKREDVFIDCLVQTAGAEQSRIVETLQCLQLVKAELGVSTVLGVSNVSHGLPRREILNAGFLAMAFAAGLDLAIANPYDQRMSETLAAANVLLGRDRFCRSYVSRFQESGSQEPPIRPGEAAAAGGEPPIQQLIAAAVVKGEQERIVALVEKGIEQGVPPLDLVNQSLIPGIEEVGRRYETNQYFLPQLILGAETMKSGFERLRPLLQDSQRSPAGTIVLATVEGDIHDIGKNIVAVLLENYGFRVIDLGKDVPAAEIVAAAEREQAELIGLSALMTTTMPRMADVIALIREKKLASKVIIGGAVVTAEYARRIGADGWATDARRGVLTALELVGKSIAKQ